MPRLSLALLLGAAVAWAGFHHGEIGLASLDARLAALGPWAPVGYVAIYALTTVPSSPVRCSGLRAAGWNAKPAGFSSG